MPSISLPTVAIIAAAGTAVSAGVAAYSAHEQGVAAANADKQKARVAQEQATQQQIGMRQKMLQALATQNATAGVGGVGVSKANTMRQITEASNDLLANRAGASAQVSLLDNAASNSVAAGNMGAAADAIGGLASAAKMLPGSAGNDSPPPPSSGMNTGGY